MAIGYHEQVDSTCISRIGVQIEYPSVWSIEDQSDLLMITSNDHGPEDKILETLDITVFPSQGETELDLADFFINNWYPENLDDFTVISRKPGSISGYPSYIFVYNYLDPDLGQLQAMDIIVSYIDKFYQLSYTSDNVYYSLYLDLIKQMVDSFRIVENVTGGSCGEDVTGGIGSGEDVTGGIGSGEDVTGGIGSGEDVTGGIGSNNTTMGVQ
jgi:hypothetical protein